MTTKNDLIGNLNKLSTDKLNDPALWKNKELNPSKIKTTIKGKVGYGRKQDSPKTGGGQGIASPLTETAGTRVYSGTSQVMYSCDGIFAFRAKPITKMSFTDANANPVDFEFELQ